MSSSGSDVRAQHNQEPAAHQQKAQRELFSFVWMDCCHNYMVLNHEVDEGRLQEVARTSRQPWQRCWSAGCCWSKRLGSRSNVKVSDGADETFHGQDVENRSVASEGPGHKSRHLSNLCYSDEEEGWVPEAAHIFYVAQTIFSTWGNMRINESRAKLELITDAPKVQTHLCTCNRY